MRLLVTVFADEGVVFVTKRPDVPGCVSQGPREALRNFREAIQQRLKVRAERGMPLTLETREIEVPA